MTISNSQNSESTSVTVTADTSVAGLSASASDVTLELGQSLSVSVSIIFVYLIIGLINLAYYNKLDGSKYSSVSSSSQYAITIQKCWVKINDINPS